MGFFAGLSPLQSKGGKSCTRLQSKRGQLEFAHAKLIREQLNRNLAQAFLNLGWWLLNQRDVGSLGPHLSWSAKAARLGLLFN